MRKCQGQFTIRLTYPKINCIWVIYTGGTNFWSISTCSKTGKYTLWNDIMKAPRIVRFSDHFALNKSQAELDFVDVPVNGDVRLFVDPYSFTLDTDPWFVECNDLIVGYFSLLIESIRAGDTNKALLLLGNLHEPEDTHLGFAKSGSTGRGIGRNQSNDLLGALKKSKAVQTGMLADLSDCELMITGISSDKISDITTNIIRGHLLDYTEAQCGLLSVPTMKVQGGVHWDDTRKSWVNRYAHLPVINGKRRVLIPKACVRFHPAVTASEFYNKYVLEFLRAEHITANTSLVYTLRTGRKKVYKKDLEKQHPFNKEMLFKFAQEHPDILQAYKAKASETSRPLEDENIELAQNEYREIDYDKLTKALDSMPTGAQHATTFHNFVYGALQAIFYPGLRYPQKEEKLHNGRKRVDITFNNGASRGFFSDLRRSYRLFSPFIFCECKNYSADPANPELDQLSGRFNKDRGQFGILVCRKIEDSDLMLSRCKDVLKDGRGWIVFLDDVDLKVLLKSRAAREFREIDALMIQKMRDLVM